jgi:hypothetical protein
MGNVNKMKGKWANKEAKVWFMEAQKWTQQLAGHAAMYSASAVLRAILDCFLLCHEIIADPKLKHHSEVLFLSATLPAQSTSVYPIRVKS